MKRFVDLYEALDSTTSTLAKVDAMQRYFRAAAPRDAAWALYFLMGKRLKRLLPTKLLVEWTLELTQLQPWLFDESYAVVGDLAETIALLLDTSAGKDQEELPLSDWIERRVAPLRRAAPEVQRASVQGWWTQLPRRELFVLNKLLTGELRVGVSSTLVVRALAQAMEVTPEAMTHRVMGNWEPSAAFFEGLTAPEGRAEDASRPYPFFLASPLEGPVEALGELAAWQVEWKWDGIRGQLLRRRGETYLWSRGEELITERFPELHAGAAKLPEGTVLDGEVMAYASGNPLPFAQLQRRIGRQKLTPAVLQEAPAAFMAYDLLEDGGRDVRDRPLAERRARLEALLTEVGPPFHVSERIRAPNWAALAQLRTEARLRNVEGLMLKRLDSAYRTGRKRGDWWKWKIDPFTVDAVLLYAQPGNGKRANLFTDYTFGVWEGEELLPVAKAYSGLTDEEISEVDRWIRAHTVERFGPVRAVEPVQVFELHFEGISESPRHKSGIAIRFPRIARWRTDKPAKEADSLEALRALLHAKVNGP